MTVDELRELLAGLPGEALVLVSGYEGGFAAVAHAGVVGVQELDRGDQEYLGRFETVAEAQLQAAQDPRGWAGMVGVPTLVGEPVTAVVLSREGR